MSKLKKDDGYAIVLAFIMLTVLIIILTAVVSLVSNEISFVSHAENSTKSFYIAEAGLEYASALFNEDDKWDGNYLKQESLNSVNNISEGTLESVIKDEVTDGITLTSTAEHRGVSKSIKVKYLVEADSGFSKYSIAASSSMTLGNKIEIIASDDGGDVYSTAGIDDHGAIYDELEVELLEYQSEPVVPDMFNQIYDKLREINSSGEEVFVTDPSVREIPSPEPNKVIKHYFGSGESDYGEDVLYIENDKTSAFTPDKDESSLSGSGILLVNGDITFPEGFEINTADDEEMLIIVNGSVQFNNAATFNGMVYASEEIRINNSVNITGGIFSDYIVKENKDSVDVVNDSVITHSSEYMKIFEDYFGEGYAPSMPGELSYSAEIVEWEEF